MFLLSLPMQDSIQEKLLHPSCFTSALLLLQTILLALHQPSFIILSDLALVHLHAPISCSRVPQQEYIMRKKVPDPCFPVWVGLWCYSQNELFLLDHFPLLEAMLCGPGDANSSLPFLLAGEPKRNSGSDPV